MEPARARPQREFVQTGGRLVHFRRAGSGPPVVLLHDSPRSSALHLPLLGEFSDEFTVFALDTPGYGQSDPLPSSPRPEIDDFGDALAGTLDALGLERPVVYAYHTSSKIALSCAVRHPGCIGRLVVDGLSLPREAVPDDFIVAYMSPFEVDPEGAYIGRQWTKIRDLHRFFPWFDRRVARRIPMDEPDSAAMHTYAMDLFMAAGHYSSAYSAAMRYRALDVLGSLTTPTTFMARANDVLHPFLDVVEAAMPSCATVERLPADDDAWRRRLREIFRSAGGSKREGPGRAAPAMRRGYHAFAHGQLQLRRFGSGPESVMVLHDPPGSGLDVADLASGLQGFRVLAPDLPGCGLSDPLGSDAVCGDYARVLAGLLDREEAGRSVVIAHGLAVPFAVALALAVPSRVSRVVLDGMPLLDAARSREIAGRYAPPIEPARDGSHFLATWHRLRDEQLQFPWYDGRATASRKVEPDLDGSRLHHRLVATLLQPSACGQACLAALGYDLGNAVASLTVPLTVLDVPGDPRYAGAAMIAQAARGRLVLRPDAAPDRLSLLQELLEGSGPTLTPL